MHRVVKRALRRTSIETREINATERHSFGAVECTSHDYKLKHSHTGTVGHPLREVPILIYVYTIILTLCTRIRVRHNRSFFVFH